MYQLWGLTCMCCSHIMMENCAYHLVAVPLGVGRLVETLVEAVLHTGWKFHFFNGTQVGVGSVDIKQYRRQDSINKVVQRSWGMRPETRDYFVFSLVCLQHPGTKEYYN